MSYRRIRLIALLLSLAVNAALSRAAITGAISGTVTDATGAVMPGVTVTVLNQGTGIKQTAISDGSGFFSFPALDVGSYTVSASRAGFTSFQVANIKVDANSSVRADIQLKVGSVTQVTVVNANPVGIETQSSELGEVIENVKLTAVPLNGRSFTDLLALQPGVSPYNSTSDVSPGPANAVSGSLQAGNVSVNGGREASNGYMINGGDVNDGVQNGTAIIPNLDSIAEFRIITDQFSAEYGNFSGGQVNVVTKSGANQFHGSAFEFLRNTSFNARNYYSTTQPKYDQNIYGGTVGGPIKKDKVFFFGDFQGTNNTQAQTETVQTASAADLTGDVSDGAFLMKGMVVGSGWANVLANRLGYPVTAGENYYTSSCTTTSQCVFPGAIIPKSAWDPVAANLFKYIPAPNTTIGASASPTGTIPAYNNSSLANTLHDYKESGRVDVNTRYGVLFAYYFMDNDASINPYGGGTDGQFPGETTGRAQLSNVGLTTTFKNNSVNSFRFSYMRSAWHSVYPTYAQPGPSLASLGFLTPWGPAGGISPIDPTYQGVPTSSMEGVTFGTPSAIDGHFDNTFQWLNNYMKVVGTHTLQAGLNYHYDEIDERNVNDSNGTLNFADGFETGYGVADFLLGAISQSFTQSSNQYLDGRSYYLGAFAEDSWRAQPNLTLNYGVRYEITTPWWDTTNKMEALIPGEQSQVFPNSPMGWVYPGDKGVPKTLAPVKHNKFAPRFGFAYTPGGSGPFSKILGGANQTSIRGGFGIFFTSYQQRSTYGEAGDVPYGDFYQASIPSMMYAPYIDRATQNIEAPKFPFNWPPKNVSVSNPFSGYNFVDAEPISGSPAVDTVNTVPYIEEYTLGIQRQLGASSVFTVNYVGSQGRHLANWEQANAASASLCGTLTGSALAPAQTPCGPNLEIQTYTLASGATQYGTGPLNIQDSCICFGNQVRYEETTATSNFNSLQTNFKHTSQMWDILLGYTYGRSMDDASGQTDLTYVFNPRLSYGLSEFNVAQYFVGSYDIHLPFDHWMSNGWGKRIAGGWAVSGITKLATGTPVTLSETDDHSETGTGEDVPNYTVGNLFAGGVNGDRNPRHKNPWFNTSLFSKETVGVFGDAHRRFFSRPGINDTDLALQRFFHIHEVNVIQFRAEAFNVFNHTQFGPPTGNINSSNFGRITSATNPRVLQLAVKYNF